MSLAFLNRVYRRDWASAILLGALIFLGGVILFALTGVPRNEGRVYCAHVA
jgi:hypothetical protein